MVMRGEVQLSKRSGFAMHLVRDPSKRCLPDIALVVKLLPERGPRKHGHRDRLEPREEGWWIEGHVEGMLQIVEAVHQIRGDRPPERQVKDAEIAIVSGHGGNTVCHSTLILRR